MKSYIIIAANRNVQNQWGKLDFRLMIWSNDNPKTLNRNVTSNFVLHCSFAGNDCRSQAAKIKSTCLPTVTYIGWHHVKFTATIMQMASLFCATVFTLFLILWRLHNNMELPSTRLSWCWFLDTKGNLSLANVAHFSKIDTIKNWGCLPPPPYLNHDN